MMRSKGMFLGALGLAVCWVSLAFTMPQAGHGNVPPGSPEKDVHVVNTVADPVPVQVAGTPSVTVAGTPNVTVSGTPNVVITNGQDKCIPVMDCDAPGRHPWHNEWFFQLLDGDHAQFKDIVFPPGKRLVIEQVTALLDADDGILPDVIIFSTNPSQPTLSLRQHLVLTKAGEVSGRSRWVSNQGMRSYVDSGIVSVQRNPDGGTVNGNIAVVGYLIDP